MMNGNENTWLRRLFLAAAVIGVVVFVLFGEEIMAWLLQEWRAMAGSALDEILK